VTVLDVGCEDGRPFVVYELLEGETLRERIGYQPTEVGQALEIGLSVARGLACAHPPGGRGMGATPRNVPWCQAQATAVRGVSYCRSNRRILQ
jgi:hypothetical protein